MKDIVVNISFEIELNELGYEDYLYGSELRIHFTDLAYNKMDGDYREALYKYIEKETVTLEEFPQDDLTQLVCEYRNSSHKTPITLEDYSEVWFVRRKGYVYMASDKKLSTVAREEGVEVHGLLHAIELILKQGRIDVDKAASMIENYITRIRHYSMEQAKEIATFMMRHFRNHATSLEDGLDLYEFMQLVSTSINSSANKTSTVR